VYPTLLVVFGLLYLWRMSDLLRFEPVTAHLSNFYLTGAGLTLTSGPRAFLESSQRRRVFVLATLFAFLNVAAEVLLAAAGVDDEVNRAMGDVNTSDPVDGMFGLTAVVAVLMVLPRRHDAAPMPVQT